MDYLDLKLIHIVSSTLLFGTGLGSAFFLFMANRSKDLAGMHFATRHVVIADWLFTAPSVVIQLVSGLELMHLGGHSLSDRWVMWGLILYFFAGACWLPVVWMQIRMRDMTVAALQNNTEVPHLYWIFNRWWTILGSLAFPAVAVVFWLMVTKPF